MYLYMTVHNVHVHVLKHMRDCMYVSVYIQVYMHNNVRVHVHTVQGKMHTCTYDCMGQC